MAPRRRVALFAVGLGPLVAGGCGTAASSPPTVPATAPTTLPTADVTVPAFGAPGSVLPATAANAMANASGACSAFSVFFLRIAQVPSTPSQAQAALGPVQQFASAASTGDPRQWQQLSLDVTKLLEDSSSGGFAASAHQDLYPSVQAVYTDCRPLQ